MQSTRKKASNKLAHHKDDVPLEALGLVDRSEKNGIADACIRVAHRRLARVPRALATTLAAATQHARAGPRTAH